MTAATWAGIAVLGGAGAVARFAVELRLGGPRGTLAVNVAGAFLAGLVSGSPVLAVGFLGAFTTFSAWMLHASRFHLAAQLAAGLAAVFLGDRLA